MYIEPPYTSKVTSYDTCDSLQVDKKVPKIKCASNAFFLITIAIPAGIGNSAESGAKPANKRVMPVCVVQPTIQCEVQCTIQCEVQLTISDECASPACTKPNLGLVVPTDAGMAAAKHARCPLPREPYPVEAVPSQLSSWEDLLLTLILTMLVIAD